MSMYIIHLFIWNVDFKKKKSSNLIKGFKNKFDIKNITNTCS